jgi:hypothetical protein
VELARRAVLNQRPVRAQKSVPKRLLERLSFLLGRTARLGEHTLARLARHPARLRLGLHAGALDELTMVLRLRLPFGFGGSGGGLGCALRFGTAHAPLILLQLVLRELAREHVVRVREGIGDNRQVEGVAQLHRGPVARRGWRSFPFCFGRRRRWRRCDHGAIDGGTLRYSRITQSALRPPARTLARDRLPYRQLQRRHDLLEPLRGRFPRRDGPRALTVHRAG